MTMMEAPHNFDIRTIWRLIMLSLYVLLHEKLIQASLQTTFDHLSFSNDCPSACIVRPIIQPKKRAPNNYCTITQDQNWAPKVIAIVRVGNYPAAPDIADYKTTQQ